MLEILQNGEARLTSNYRHGECDDQRVHYFDLGKTKAARILKSEELAWIYLGDYFGLHQSAVGAYSCVLHAERDFTQILDALDAARCSGGQDTAARPGDPHLHTLVTLPDRPQSSPPAQDRRRFGVKKAIGYGAAALLVLVADRLASDRLWGGGEATRAVRQSAAAVLPDRQQPSLRGSAAAVPSPWTPRRASEMSQRPFVPEPAEIPAAGPAAGSLPFGLNPPPPAPPR